MIVSVLCLTVAPGHGQVVIRTKTVARTLTSGRPGPGGGRNQRYFLLPQRHLAIAWRRRRRQAMAKWLIWKRALNFRKRHLGWGGVGWGVVTLLIQIRIQSPDPVSYTNRRSPACDWCEGGQAQVMAYLKIRTAHHWSEPSCIIHPKRTSSQYEVQRFLVRAAVHTHEDEQNENISCAFLRLQDKCVRARTLHRATAHRAKLADHPPKRASHELVWRVIGSHDAVHAHLI